MSSESRSVPNENLGSLKGCLVEGDPERRMRERHVRRAFAISVALQSTAVAALILIPLLGRPEHIALAVMPLPPYYAHHQGRPAKDPEPRNPRPANICKFCPPLKIPPTIPTHDPPPDGNDIVDIPGIGNGPEMPGQIPLVDPRPRVKPPSQIETRPDKPVVVHRTKLDPAMLIHRVEPVFPTLARQIGRGGRVDLHAIIATDGTIQSLQVVGGDPLFYQSALEAVRQWRYTPTVLNGRAVEVDTYINVIYTMQR
jgi:TonB family protein